MQMLEMLLVPFDLHILFVYTMGFLVNIRLESELARTLPHSVLMPLNFAWTPIPELLLLPFQCQVIEALAELTNVVK